MKNYALFCFLVFFLNKKSLAQYNDSLFTANQEYEKGKIFLAYLPKLKYEYGAVNSINMGFSFINYSGEEMAPDIPVWFYTGPFIESGLAYKDSRKYLNNKIGFECFYLFTGGRLNLVHYTDFEKHQFAIRPEFGFSFFSVFTLTYGYNFNLISENYFKTKGGILALNLAYPLNRK